VRFGNRIGTTEADEPSIWEVLVRLQVKGKNVEVTDSIRQYAQQKLGKLERQLDDPTRVELELAVERNPSISANHVAEATIWTKGPILRAREASADHKASIDQLVDKLERQVKRYREKRRKRRGAGGAAPEPIPDDAIPIESEPRIVKSKQFAVKPMSPEEAVLQLELVGHDFFVFQNAETMDVNVVYRRRDGAFGLIEPQL
jgi:putative sigma-54 modulation protein